MKKRGSQALGVQLIYALSFVLVIAFIMLPILKKVDLYNNSEIERAYIAKDLGFILESSYASQGNTKINYPITKFNFEYILTPEKITINNPDEESEISYSFFKEKDITINENTLTPPPKPTPFFKKTPLNIELSKDQVLIKTNSCSNIDLPKLENIMIDIGYGENTHESWEVLFNIGKILLLDPKIKTTKDDKDSKQDLNLNSRISRAKDEDFILALYSNDEKHLNIYYPLSNAQDKNNINKKIACELSNKFNFESSIIPLDLDSLQKEDTKNILIPQYAIYLELPQNIEEPNQIPEKIKEILNEIKKK